MKLLYEIETPSMNKVGRKSLTFPRLRMQSAFRFLEAYDAVDVVQNIEGSEPLWLFFARARRSIGKSA